MENRICICGVKVSRQSKSGKCQKCFLSRNSNAKGFLKYKEPITNKGLRVCRVCFLEKDIDNFQKAYKNRIGIYSRETVCRPCLNKIKLKQRKTFLEKNPEKASILRLENKIRSKDYIRKNRMLCLQHYGGHKPRCKCCGEYRYEFLALDHIDNNGNKHRKTLGNVGTQFYRWLIKNKFPTNLQVLCHNCNVAKGLYGKCPHIVL